LVGASKAVTVRGGRRAAAVVDGDDGSKTWSKLNRGYE